MRGGGCILYMYGQIPPRNEAKMQPAKASHVVNWIHEHENLIALGFVAFAGVVFRSLPTVAIALATHMILSRIESLSYMLFNMLLNPAVRPVRRSCL